MAAPRGLEPAIARLRANDGFVRYDYGGTGG
jgi:hypothetical protein